MLWYKSWMETRWRFLIGLAVLIVSTAGTVLAYPRIIRLLPLLPKLDLSGEMGRQIAESMELLRDYRGYVWSQWFLKNMPQMWGLFAVLLGTGGLLSQGSGRGALFTLSLPASRNRLLGVRAATGLAELLLLAFVPSLLLPVLSPAVGQTYGLGDALIHSACLFIAGAVFFSLAFLVSSVFSGLWRPILIVLCVATVLAFFGQVLRDLPRYSLFRVISAQSYFRGGGLPWPGLLASAVASGAMLYGAAINFARRDF